MYVFSIEDRSDNLSTSSKEALANTLISNLNLAASFYLNGNAIIFSSYDDDEQKVKQELTKLDWCFTLDELVITDSKIKLHEWVDIFVTKYRRFIEKFIAHAGTKNKKVVIGSSTDNNSMNITFATNWNTTLSPPITVDGVEIYNNSLPVTANSTAILPYDNIANGNAITVNGCNITMFNSGAVNVLCDIPTIPFAKSLADAILARIDEKVEVKTSTAEELYKDSTTAMKALADGRTASVREDISTLETDLRSNMMRYRELFQDRCSKISTLNATLKGLESANPLSIIRILKHRYIKDLKVANNTFYFLTHYLFCRNIATDEKVKLGHLVLIIKPGTYSIGIRRPKFSDVQGDFLAPHIRSESENGTGYLCMETYSSEFSDAMMQGDFETAMDIWFVAALIGDPNEHFGNVIESNFTVAGSSFIQMKEEEITEYNNTTKRDVITKLLELNNASSSKE